jgi:SAM-dependent methyltransferase
MELPLSLYLLGVAGIAGAAYFLFASFLFGAGYQPTPRRVVSRMLELGAVGPGDRLYDLGAGTGAILFRAARERGAVVLGVEVEPIRMLILWLRRLVGGPRDRVSLRWGNLFGTDLSQATVVAVFLWPGAMRRLRSLLERQLRPGSRVVSHWHPVPGWTPALHDKETRVYLYQR